METRKFYASRRRGLNVALESARTARVDVTLSTDKGSHSASVSLPLMGPGDVQGLLKGMVTRRWPAPGSTKTPAGNVAYVEFADDDLPWLLSPKAGARPTPWLTLLVVPDAADKGVTWRADRSPLPEILIDAQLSSTLPDPEEAWILAHTEAKAGGDISRLLSARWLAPGTRWRAVLVPLFEVGRRAGLGEDTAGATGFSVTPGQSLRLPVYDSWTFSTSTTPSFEDLVKDLAPAQVAATPPYVAWSEATQSTLGATGVLAQSWLRSALRHEDIKFEAVSDPVRYTAPRLVHAQADKLRRVVDRDDVICPPRYGRWTARSGDVPEADWFDDINLDPSLRLAAGYGAEIVRRHQEKLVRAAWDFAGQVEEANYLIGAAGLGAQAARKLHKQLSRLSPERLIALSEPAHARIRAPQGPGSSATTLAGTAYEGGGLASRVMRRAARQRLGTRGSTQPGNLHAAAKARGATFVPQGLPTFEPKVEPPVVPRGKNPRPRPRPRPERGEMSVAHAAKLLGVPLGVDRIGGSLDPRLIGAAQQNMNHSPPQAAGNKSLPAINATSFSRHLLETLQPVAATGARLRERVGGGNADPFEAIRPEPALDFPLLEALAEISPGLVSPALSSLKPNRLTLLELDRAFCEAVMVGANHELMRELIWRKYPGRLDMTPLTRLFPRQALSGEVPPVNDARPLRGWTQAAGKHLTNSVKSILLLRTDLFALFPETVMFVFPAVWNAQGSRDLAPSDQYEPVQARVRGQLPPDAMYLGYPLDASELRGTARKPRNVSAGSTQSAGYYLVFHGPAAQDSFGFDSPDGPSASTTADLLQTWDDLAWTHVGWEQQRPNISLRDATTRRPGNADAALSLGSDSAALAAIMASRSLTVAMHLSDLIDPIS